jgi:integrase
MADKRDPTTRQRDAALVATLAYSGLRPGEAAALRWSDVRDRTILAQRATESDGAIKSTKGRKSRSVRLLSPPMAKEDWGNWRRRTWRTACCRAGLPDTPRPYDLRHSFASLLLAEGRTIHYVAAQLGHSPALTLGTYGHVLAEFADSDRIDSEAEIARARGDVFPQSSLSAQLERRATPG